VIVIIITMASKLTTLAASALIAITPFLVTGCGERDNERKEEHGSRSWIYKTSILEDSCNVERESISYNYPPRFGIEQRSSNIDKSNYTIKFNEPGEYNFKFWGRQYRATDKMIKSITFKIEKPRETRLIEINSPHYRIEVNASVNNDLLNEQIKFSVYNNHPQGDLVNN